MLHVPWPHRAAPPALPTKQVHIWLVDLRTTASARERLLPVLTAAERTRALRFIFEKDQQQFIVARGCLRQLLEYYTGQPASRIAFTEGPHGKPALAPSQNADDLHFNVSHSQGYALYAFCRDAELGIDLEGIRPTTDVAAIAQRFFSPQETETLLTANAEHQRRGFFTYWTRKEAYLKAIGKGLTMPLNQFNIGHFPDHGFVHAKHASGYTPTSWFIQDLAVGSGFKAAICTYKNEWHLTHGIWTP